MMNKFYQKVAEAVSEFGAENLGILIIILVFVVGFIGKLVEGCG